MSKYSEISERIGHKGYCAIPSIDMATDLKKAVMLDNSFHAFELVFKINRFAPLPITKDEVEAMHIISLAFGSGIRQFCKN
ncbi:hypothetical protein [Carboxylicivirga linearis]|uniref:Uncharacterized protein n=1 Tax=Carboxylicivirga linearis TaxID=1628157 RepID=A0ABS5JZS0_9BACT|nr:hypothetical protein [Carboxylicivirga linearis]MBS2100412.1 hypothetical protein [Carboxylicivirga linearis]